MIEHDNCRPCYPPRETEADRLRRRLRDMEIERNALRIALRLTLEAVGQTSN